MQHRHKGQNIDKYIRHVRLLCYVVQALVKPEVQLHLPIDKSKNFLNRVERSPDGDHKAYAEGVGVQSP